MTKKGIIFSIVGLTIVLILLLGVLFVGLLGVNFNFISREYKKVVFTEVYDDVEDIKIDANLGNIYLKYSDNDSIKVEIASKEKYVDVKDEEGIININVKGPQCKFLCVNTKASRITIYLPKDYANKVYANLDMGDLKTADFKNLKLEVDNDMGDVKVDGVASLSGKVSMGDFKIQKIYNYVNIKNNMGDIKIDNLTITKNSNIKSNMGDVKITKTNDIFIDAHTSMGDVKVKKSNRKAKYSITIKNDMGDIKVNY